MTKDSIIAQNEMLEYYTESSVHCAKCNIDIGNLVYDECPNCGFDVNESLTQWIIKNAKFAIKQDDT